METQVGDGKLDGSSCFVWSSVFPPVGASVCLFVVKGIILAHLKYFVPCNYVCNQC